MANPGDYAADLAGFAIGNAISEALDLTFDDFTPEQLRMMLDDPELPEELRGDIHAALIAAEGEDGSAGAAGAGAPDPRARPLVAQTPAEVVEDAIATPDAAGIRVIAFHGKAGAPPLDVRFACQAFLMDRSTYVWLGPATGEANMPSLTAASLFRGEAALSPVLRRGADSESVEHEESLARRISLGFGEPCFVSCSLPAGLSPETRLEVEAQVIRRLRQEKRGEGEE